MCNKKEQAGMREEWKLKDPVSFDRQEARRAAYLADKNARSIASLVIKGQAESEDAHGTLGAPVGSLPVEFGEGNHRAQRGEDSMSMSGSHTGGVVPGLFDFLFLLAAFVDMIFGACFHLHIRGSRHPSTQLDPP